MNKVFDFKDRHKLDDPERQKEMPSEHVLDLIRLDSGHVFLDIGAGTGYFSIPALKKVGEKGKVIAADISAQMLLEIGEKTGNPRNLLLIETTQNEIFLPSLSVDRILMSMVLHEIEEQERYLKDITDILREDGIMTFVEWKKIETGNGPPNRHRISQEELNRMATKAGLVLQGTHQYDQVYVSLFKK